MFKLIKKHVAILVVFIMLFQLVACTQPGMPEETTPNNETSNNEISNNDPQKDEVKSIQASVIEIEKYGHAVLNLTTAEFFAAGYALGDVVCVRFGSYEFKMPFYDGYYTNPGGVMLRGLAPEKNIGVCINYGDLSVETGIAVGDAVEITLAEKAGMLAYQELCSLKYSNSRADYTDDATFANFRVVTLGTIGSGKLYRSASPINNEHGRAKFANAFIQEANVATVLNLADSEEDIAEYIAAEDFESEYYLSLYESGKVIVLDLTANFYSEKFATSLVDGLRFLAQNDPPYVVHCTEGNDRAGFTIMLLSALMGADLQSIIDDYMISFYNYYGIDKESQPERYEVVLENNLMAMLYHVMDVDSLEELENTDLQVAVTKYLMDNGMTEEEILTLKEKLS